MAGYREFHFEKIYEAPDTTGFLDNYTRAMSNMFAGLADTFTKRQQTINQHSVDLAKGAFENDQVMINDMALNLVQEGRSILKRGGNLSDPNYQERLYSAKTLSASSKINFDRFKQDLDRIDKRRDDDKYYDKRYDEASVLDAAYGEGADLLTRGSRLADVEKNLFQNPQSFKHKQYTADWVNNYGQKEKIKTTGNPDAKSSIENKARFWDPKTGKPGVTDDHAIDYLRSEERVDKWYDYQLDQTLSDEIKKMKSSGDSRAAWMEGLSDNEIKAELINDPSKNLITKTDYGIRKREMAKRDLEEADSVHSKISYEKKLDDRTTGGLYRNDAIAYSPTFNTTQTGAVSGVSTGVSEAAGMNQLSAPGGILVISKGLTTGKPINIQVEGKNGYDITSGKKSQIVGRQPFNLTGYQLQVYQKDGRPFPLAANNTTELITKINSMRPHEFKNLSPEPAIALNGYTVDRNTMLGDMAKNTLDIETELGQAIKNGDETKATSLQERLDMINEFKQALNDPDSFADQDILNLAARNGISQIRKDMLMKASGSDLDWVNNVTQGLNLRDRNKWSDDMRTFDEAYRSAYRKASEVGFGESPTEKFEKAVRQPTQKQQQSNELPTIGSDDEYKKLPSGSEFIAPNGQRYRKP